MARPDRRWPREGCQHEAVTSSDPVPPLHGRGPSMRGISNFRGIGGLPTVDGRTTVGGLLWRSGHLAAATAADLARLEALAIRTVVDLRTGHDIAADGPDQVPDGVVERPVPIPDDAGLGADIRAMILRGDEDEMRAVWSDDRAQDIAVRGAAVMATAPDRVATFAEVFSVVLDPGNWPLVWHCSAGKDRAGWVGTALLLLLGVERDAVVAHYLESNRVGTRRADRRVAAGLEPVRLRWVTMNRDAIRSAIDRAVDEFASGEATWADEEMLELRRQRVEVDTFGMADAEITHAVDVTAVISRKRDAIRAHASQVAADSFFLSMPDETFAATFGTEWFVDPGRPRDGRTQSDDLLLA